ncbi:MAG: aldo/keto reductase [Verrucomicrobiota bacterium]
MIYRRFGKTELKMPLVTCGGMRFQHKWEDVEWGEVPPEGQKNLEECIAYALENGVNHFETARGYGSSEMQLSRAFAHFPREDMMIQTKVSPEGGAKKFEETFEKSMAYLKLDYVDLLGVHGINNRDLLEEAKECIEIAEKWREQGRVRHIGFSTHAGTEEIHDAIETGLFDYINIHWYFVNDFNWSCIEAAMDRDMGVFIISPNDKGGKLYEPSEKLRALCDPLDPMHFNDLYCWARPEIHTLSMGVARPEDFDAHIKALEDLDQAKELVAPIEARLRAEVDAVCGENWDATWTRGIPEWWNMPQSINVREIIRLWTYSKSLDIVEWGKMRYNLLGNAGHWFPGEKAGDFDDSEIIAAMGDYRYADRVPEILRDADAMLRGEDVKRQSKGD